MSGTRTMSSWLSGPAPPFGWRMPITRKGIPPIVMSRADRVRPEPEVAWRWCCRGRQPAVPGRSTARSGTSPARSCRCGPSRSRAASRRSSSWCSGRRRRRASGSTARGRRRRRRGSGRRRVASSIVRRRRGPRRSARPEAGGAARVDREQVRARGSRAGAVIPLVAPWPTATRATTEPTPMITPSIVRTARSRAERSRARASRTRSSGLMRRAARRGRGSADRRSPRRRRRG